MPTMPMFETFADRAQERIEDVLSNRGCKWPASYDQKTFLGLFRAHQGRARVIALGEIGERLRMSPREVKDMVQDLRLNFYVPICASRDGDSGGYFLAATLAEIDDSNRPMFRQAITMLRVCKAMRGPDYTTAEVLGQLRLELEQEEA